MREKSDRTHGTAINIWDKVDQAFEDRLVKLLNQMGVPNYKDRLELTQRVDTLNAQLDALRQVRETLL